MFHPSFSSKGAFSTTNKDRTVTLDGVWTHFNIKHGRVHKKDFFNNSVPVIFTAARRKPGYAGREQ